MAMTPYEVLAVEQASDEDTAYDYLRLTAAGNLPLFVADASAKFNIESDKAQEILSGMGFGQGEKTYSFAFGNGGAVLLHGFHRDGEPGSNLVQGIHSHETPSGLARASFVPMVQKPPCPLSEYVDWQQQRLDSDFLEPRVYRTTVEVGMVAVFAVSGRNALAHLFETLPDHLAYREAVIKTFHRV